MARLWSCGFELQSSTNDVEITSWSGASTVNTTTVRSGSASQRTAPTTTATNFYTFSGNALDGFYARAYVRFEAFPTTTATKMMAFADGAGNMRASVRITTSGTLELWNDEDAAQVGSASSALSTGVWYRIELKCDTTTAASTAVEARIDGSSFASGTINLASGGIGRLYWGAVTTSPGSGYEVYFDDMAVNDDSGSDQNSWPGEGKIVHLRPTSDVSNTGTVTRAGADSGTIYGQLDEATPNDTTDYITMTGLSLQQAYMGITSSATAGIDAADSVTLLQAGIRFRRNVTNEVFARVRLRSQAGGTFASATASVTGSNDWHTNNVGNPRNYLLTSYTDPQAGGAWTPALIDTANIGVLNAGSPAYEIAFTAAWVLVEYVPDTGALTLEPADASIGLTVDNTTITQNHIIQPQDLNVGLSLDNTTVARPKLETFVENFDDGVFDTVKWDDQTSGGATETGGVQEIVSTTFSSYRQVVSVQTYDLTDSYGFVQIVDAGDQALISRGTIFYLEIDANNKVYWQVVNSQIEAHKIVGGVATLIAGTTYTSASHQYFRLRQTGATVYWEYSADGSSWTTFHSETAPIDTTALRVGLQVGNWQTEASASISKFDNFNLTPSTVTIASNDVALSLGVDATTISQIHAIVPTDAQLGLSVDATTITQNHVIQPQDISVGLAVDTATLSHNYVLTPADILHSLGVDATIVTQQDIIIQANDLSIGVALDVASIFREAYPESNIIIRTTSDTLTIRGSSESITIRGVQTALTIRGVEDTLTIRF